MSGEKETQSKRGKPFQKGNPGGGRPAGVPNKVTTEFRETVRQLLEDNRANVAVWLDQVAHGVGSVPPNPAKALDILAGLAEFAAPKLSRTEVTGANEGPIDAKLIIEYVRPKDPAS